MSPDEMKRYRTRFLQAQDNVDQIVVEALATTYKELVGKEPSDKMNEALFEAIRTESWR